MRLINAAFALALAAAALPAAAQAENRIGFVNTARILRDAVPAVRAQKKIETEFAKRDQEIAKAGDQLKRPHDKL